MKAAALLPLVALAACHAEKPDWAKEGHQTAVPAAACKEIEKGVAQLRASAGMEIGNDGEVMMPADAWNGMTSQQHDGLVRTVAFHASCAAGTQSDGQEVVIRGDDGSELARRTISTRVDTSELLREQDR